MTQRQPPARPFGFVPPPPPGPGRGLAIAALVLGICSLIPFLGMFTALVGIVLGIVALAVKGRGKAMAVAGILLCLVGGAETGALVAMGFRRGRKMAQRAVCMTNLHQIGLGVLMYTTDNNDMMPPDLSALTDQDYIPSGQDSLQCPTAPEKGQAGYFYVPIAQRASSVTKPARAIIACDRVGNHPGQRNVLFLDGHTQLMSEPQFQAALAQPINAEFAKALKEAEGP